MFDELALDERVEDPERRIKTTVFRCVIDSVYVQLKERLQTEDLAFMHCMRFFTPAFLVSSLPVTEDDIKVVCEFYNVDTSVIVKELTDF